jgi:hypothetical protein
MESQYLLTNGTVAREYLAKRLIVPASLRTKDYDDLSNVSGDRIVLMNGTYTNQILRDSVLFDGWNNNGVSIEMSTQVLIEIPKQKGHKLSPNKYFTVLEGSVIPLGPEVNVYVSDYAVKNAYEDFLNRFDDCNTDGISVQVMDDLRGGEDSDELEADLSWIKSLSKAVPISRSEFERFERTASTILVTLSHASTEKQRQASAALFVRRPLPNGILGSIVEHRRDASEPKDQIFSRIADLVLASDRVGDAKAAALNNSWVSKIRTLAKSRDTVLHGVLDGIDKFLENSLSWDKIDRIEDFPALQAFVFFLRDSGKIPNRQAGVVSPMMSDVDFASIYLSALMVRRSDLALIYRRPVVLESLAASLVASSLNKKSANLDVSLPEFKFVYERDIFFVNDVQVSHGLNAARADSDNGASSNTGLSTERYIDTWEILTSKKVVIEFNGMKITYSPTGPMKFSFLEEPKSEKKRRLSVSNTNIEPTATESRSVNGTDAATSNGSDQVGRESSRAGQTAQSKRSAKSTKEPEETPMLPLENEK